MNGLWNVKFLKRAGFIKGTIIQQHEQIGGVDLTGNSVFDEVVNAEYVPGITINPTHGLSAYRLLETTANGGSIAEDAGTFRLRTSTTANGSAEIETTRHGDYSAGSMGLAGVLAFLNRLPTGNEEAKWGFFDQNDGFFAGHDSTSYFIQRRVGGVDQAKVRPVDWIDPLDGTGDSGATLDALTPAIVRFRMALYGQGPCQVYFLVEGPTGDAKYVHVYSFWSDQGQLIVENWGLPLKAEITNGGDSTSLDLHIGGMQFGTIGQVQPERRTSCETVIEATLDGTTIVPLISFQKKTTREDINAVIRSFDILSADDLIVYVFLGATLTGASFGSFTNIADDETALEVDTSATAISNGNALFEAIHAGGTGQNAAPSEEELSQPIPNGVPVTLAVRKVTSTGGTATATFKAREFW